MEILGILTLLGILFLATFFVVVFFYLKQVSNFHSFLLQDIADKNNLTLNKTESSTTLFLGLDRKNKKLIVVEPKNNEDPLVVDLQQIALCEVRMDSPQDFPEKELISMILSHVKEDKPSLEIIFYDESDLEKRRKTDQVNMAKRWCKYVKDVLPEAIEKSEP